jgi:hypothetical protein
MAVRQRVQTHRCQIGEPPQGASNRLQTGLDQHAKAAPLKRNDAILAVLPIGVMHFPGAGIQDNLAEQRGSASPLEIRQRAERERRHLTRHVYNRAAQTSQSRPTSAMLLTVPWWCWKA